MLKNLKNIRWLIVLIFVMEMQLLAQPYFYYYGKNPSAPNKYQPALLRFDMATELTETIIPDTLSYEYSILWSTLDLSKTLFVKHGDFKTKSICGMNARDYDNYTEMFDFSGACWISPIFDSPINNKLYLTLDYGYEDDEDKEKTLVIDRDTYEILDTLPPICLEEMKFADEPPILSRDETKVYQLNQGSDVIEFRSISLLTGEILEEHIIIDNVDSVKVKKNI